MMVLVGVLLLVFFGIIIVSWFNVYICIGIVLLVVSELGFVVMVFLWIYVS